jgi:hypothetical protein
MPLINLSGRSFGRWTVLKRHTRRPSSRKALWLCQCVCGNKKIIYSFMLLSGRSKSCGCLHLEILRNTRGKRHSQFKHGWSQTAEYVAFHHAKARCTNQRDRRYHDWGGRGIRFLFVNFDQFFAELGPRPSRKHSVDRINNDGNYEPGNVRWATMQQQRANRRRVQRQLVTM